MGGKRARGATVAAQGVELIEIVIGRVRADPTCIAGFCGDAPLYTPRPLASATLDRLTFPSGKPLPPSLRRWLALDASWLASFGWFASSTDFANPVFTPRRIDEIVRDELDDSPLISRLVSWSEMYAPLTDRFPECFLLPGGSDSRRIYAVTETPDAMGDYPVLVVDIDDLPYAAVMYPGFDVFLGDEVGLGLHPFDTYEALHDDPRYATRMRHHALRLFDGKRGIEMADEEWTLPYALWEAGES
ncbi:MAG TPA: hypothetical protein VF120_04560 [Ktedonobacterales bacterium]